MVYGCQFLGLVELGGRSVIDVMCRRVYRWLSEGIVARIVEEKGGQKGLSIQCSRLGVRRLGFLGSLV